MGSLALATVVLVFLYEREIKCVVRARESSDAVGFGRVVAIRNPYKEHLNMERERELLGFSFFLFHFFLKYLNKQPRTVPSGTSKSYLILTYSILS